jgi:hypothetical protein
MNVSLFKEKKLMSLVELKGLNWLKNKHYPVAIFFGFNSWKRDIFSRFFKEYRAAFVIGNNSLSIPALLFFREIGNDFVIIKWGRRRLPYLVRAYIFFNKSVKVISVEDSFLRSNEIGTLHTRPVAINADDVGIYFDATRKSNIENLLNDYEFNYKDGLLKRAEAGIELIKKTGLSKYYNGLSVLKKPVFKRTGNYSILIVGQVESDASIQFGRGKIKTNLGLAKQAQKDYPTADLYFRPHPDYLHGNNLGVTPKISTISKMCIILEEEIPLNQALNEVDHVYTMTSLIGLEALIKGRKVTTVGAPFYSNWGLTIDKVKINRRKRKRSIEELFAIAYIIHPKYFHLLSDEEIIFEEAAHYFLIESLLDIGIFTLDNVIFNSIKNQTSCQYAPVNILKYLSSTKSCAEAQTDKVLEIANNNFKLRDYMQISRMLILSSNYDALIQYSNKCLSHFYNNIDQYIENTILINSFFYSISLSQRSASGRVINEIPDMVDIICSIPGNDNYSNSIVKNYMSCLSNNLQYKEIEKLVQKILEPKLVKSYQRYWSFDDFIGYSFSIDYKERLYKECLQVLNINPSRSERDSERRAKIKVTLAGIFLKILDKKFTGEYNFYLNKALYYLILEDFLAAEKQVLSYIKLVGIDRFLGIIIEKNRLNDLLYITNFMINKKRMGTVGLYIQLIRENDIVKDKLPAFNFTLLSYYKSINNLEDFYMLIDSLSLELSLSDRLIGLKAKTLREEGYFENSLELYEKLYSNAKTSAKRSSIKIEIDKLEFVIESSQILNSIPQPKFPKGVVFIASQTCYNSLAMMIPSYVELKKLGYAVINLTQGMSFEAPTNIDFIDKFHGAIPLTLTKSATIKDLTNAWEVDWNNKKIISNKINFYQGFYEGLSVGLRRYYVDLNKVNASKAFIGQLVRADTCLTICNRIYQEIVIEKGFPVTFVSGNSHIVPFSIFRDFARNKKHIKLGFVNCNASYESYFSNLGSKIATTMCVTDMTLHPTIRAPFLARSDQFEPWYKKNSHNNKYLKQAEELINVNRVGLSSNEKEIKIMKYLDLQKTKGKKIVCAFGKVPIDLAVPFDGGPAHQDMSDWINHTVKICSKNQDIVLLVKPHPHEVRPEIALDLVYGFNELITEDIGDNVCLLQPKDINSHTLAPYIDLAILYNGSSSLELTFQGLPVMMTSYFGRYDYPVDLLYPKSRKSYEQFIESLDYPEPGPVTKKKAAFLICYMGTEEISISNQYSTRPITNDKIGMPKWNKQKVRGLLAHGDEKMTLIANRVVEKFSTL